MRFCGYVPTRHRQTNNGVELWAAPEALQGFWVPKLAILTDSQYLQLGATGRAQHWKSKGWTTTSGKLQVHVPSAFCREARQQRGLATATAEY